MYLHKILSAILLGGVTIVQPVVASAKQDLASPPAVPFQYGLGLQNYQALCSQCHGEWADGSDNGPPLIHPYYKPGHHSDEAFYRAVLDGAKAHHWGFGDMPPVEKATPKDIQPIIVFIRWLQQEYGIF